MCEHKNLMANGFHSEKDDNGVKILLVDVLVCCECGDTIVCPPLTLEDFKRIKNG